MWLYPIPYFEKLSKTIKPCAYITINISQFKRVISPFINIRKILYKLNSIFIYVVIRDRIYFICIAFLSVGSV